MSITEQQLREACRREAEKAVYDPGGWLPSLQSELTKLTTPSIAKLPVAIQRITLLNSLIGLVDATGDLKKIKGGGNPIKYMIKRMPAELEDVFRHSAKFTLAMINLSLKDIKRRIVNHLHHLDRLMAHGFIDIKHQFALTLNNASADIMSHNASSWFNQIIFPAVLMTGKKRLPDIKHDLMAQTYCRNLFLISGLFNIHYSGQQGAPSIADALHSTYDTMARRIQQIYFAVNQTTGFEQIVHVRPPIERIQRCIIRYQKEFCGRQARKETVATRGWISPNAAILYLSAWYLEVDRSDGVVIQLLRNPKSFTALLDQAVTNEMAFHLDELVSVAREEMAWKMTVGMTG